MRILVSDSKVIEEMQLIKSNQVVSSILISVCGNNI